MKKIILLLTSIVLSSSVFSQLSMMKMIGGTYSKDYKTGFGAFYTVNIPLNEVGNRAVTLDLIDIAFLPVKSTSPLESDGGFVSFKAGYRYIFSEESKTGFYIEPQVGYALTFVGPENDAGDEAGKGLALALNAGYSLEVGERGNSFTFGLKYEANLAGNDMSVHSVGLRVAYNFSIFRRRNDY
jgi:hypothetical protein